MKIISFVLLMFATLNCYSQSEKIDGRRLLGKKYAEQELKKALSDTTTHNVIGKGKILIKEESDAIKIAEVILFPLYSEKEIVEQRPYEVYFIENYWIISGTLPNIPYLKGGTFLIIMDARDGRIIRITHGQ